MAKLVIADVDLQARDKFGNTALLCAAKSNTFADINTNSIKANESMLNQIDKEAEREDEVEDGRVLDTVGKIVEETIETVDINESLHNPTINDDVKHLIMDEDRNEMSPSKKTSLSISVSDHSNMSVKNESIHPCMMNVPDFSDQRLISILIQLGKLKCLIFISLKCLYFVEILDIKYGTK